MGKAIYKELGSTPSAPSSGYVQIYAKTDGRIYFMDDTGVEYPMRPTGAGTGDLLADGTVPLTANWDVGSFTVTAEKFEAPAVQVTPGTAPTHSEGLVYYDNAEYALSYYNEEADVTINVGQEAVLRVRNSTGSTITNGSVVYVSGSTGEIANIALAQSSTTHLTVLGVATHDIENNTFGYITTFGIVRDINTTGFTAGDLVYLSTTAGQFTATKPAWPNEVVEVGTIIKSAAAGKLFVFPRHQYLHDLSVDETPKLGGNLDVNGKKITSISNGNIDIEPNGTGNVLLGNFVFNADQVVGAGTDGYTLTYDNGTGEIQLEAATGSGLLGRYTTVGITAAAGDVVYADTTSAALTVTLPASPTDGDVIFVFDYGSNASVNNITIGRNGNNIDGAAADSGILWDGMISKLMWDNTNSTWREWALTPHPDSAGGTFEYTADIETVANQDYVFWWDAPFAGSITKVRTKSQSGTCTVTGKINTTALGGTANSASSTAQEQSHSTSNTFVKGDKILVTISSNSSCIDLAIALYGTRS